MSEPSTVELLKGVIIRKQKKVEGIEATLMNYDWRITKLENRREKLIKEIQELEQAILMIPA